MKKKILYYSDCYFFGGCENMIANFMNSNALNDEFEVHFIYRYSERYEEGAKNRINSMSNCEGVCLVVEPEISRYVKSSNGIIQKAQKIIWAFIVLFTKYWAIYRNTNILRHVFSNINPDIIHINNGGYPAATSAQAAVFAAHKCGIKDIYYVVNNMAVGYKTPFRWFDILVDPFVKKYVKKFITGSNNAGICLRNILNIPQSKQITLRNGIKLRSTTMSMSMFKKMYGIDEGKLVFSTVANLEVRKGHRYLLQAIKELIDENKIYNSIFIFEGKGPLEAFIKQYIKVNNLSEYVKLISVSAIYDLYASTDVTILPSISHEDFPNTIIESFGMGIPVIGTCIAGIPEQIIQDENGILIEPTNVAQLKKAILKMIVNNDFRITCGCKAKEIFLQNYTAEKSVEKYIELYKA